MFLSKNRVKVPYYPFLHSKGAKEVQPLGSWGYLRLEMMYSKCPKVRNLESKKGVSAVGKLLLEK